MLYNLCKRMIENKNFTSKEDMQHKFDVFLLGNRLTEEEYKELTQMLELT